MPIYIRQVPATSTKRVRKTGLLAIVEIKPERPKVQDTKYFTKLKTQP
jgi:hypothetical protein